MPKTNTKATVRKASNICSWKTKKIIDAVTLFFVGILAVIFTVIAVDTTLSIIAG